MGYVESFVLNGVPIKTAVIDDFVWERDHISTFFSQSHDKGTKVIGFDTEWILTNKYTPREDNVRYFYPECATVHLCDGSSCLVIHLNYNFGGSSAPFDTYNWLHNYLSLPNYTFVGVGIKDKLAKLEKFYGVGCGTSVELGPLAASFLNMPRLSYCGIDELCSVVNNFDLRHHRPPSTMSFQWGCRPLPKELAKLAAVNVYSYYMIGSKLLGPNFTC